MATHGDARNNYNNQPFVGHTAEGDFALCHNGVLFNYEQVQKQEQLPKTRIKTDSYTAVQLIEKYGKADFETIGKTAGQLDYLQVFRLDTTGEGDSRMLHIRHEQEQPDAKMDYVMPTEIEINCKVYIIDDIDHVTMLLAEVY